MDTPQTSQYSYFEDEHPLSSPQLVRNSNFQLPESFRVSNIRMLTYREISESSLDAQRNEEFNDKNVEAIKILKKTQVSKESQKSYKLLDKYLKRVQLPISQEVREEKKMRSDFVKDLLYSLVKDEPRT